MNQVFVLDTTLRDGTQGEGVSLTVADKFRIAEKLDGLGVAFIEGGFPGANPKDAEFFRRAKTELHLSHAKLTAFGSTRRPHAKPEEDEGLRLLLDAETPVVTIVGKTWDFHVHEALRVSLEENLLMISETVLWLKHAGREVIFDAEHFFDGYANNPAYALQAVQAASQAGADWVTLCDTNGGRLPHEISDIVREVCKSIKAPVGVHTHNDCELAVANSLVAVAAGATMVHGTINGIGERCGNANLASIIPNLELKLGIRCLAGPESIKLLTETARFVAEMANLVPHSYQPFVGHSAFAHKGGIHVSAIQRNPQTYEHIDPQQIGNRRRILVSELAGVSNLQSKAEALGIDTTGKKDVVRSVLHEIKELEHQGYQFEGAEASQELLLVKRLGQYASFFDVSSVRVQATKEAQQDITSEAIVKLLVQERPVHTVAEGTGPVHALDVALRKALTPFYPIIETMHLTDYKVRVLDERNGTAAKVRVLIESTNGHDVWSTVGVSENVIGASFEALADSLSYFLLCVAKVNINQAIAVETDDAVTAQAGTGFRF